MDSTTSRTGCCENGSVQEHKRQKKGFSTGYLLVGSSAFLLLVGLYLDYVEFILHNGVRLFVYGIAYITVAWPVLKQTILHFLKGDIFTEFFLMSLSTLCAFALGEYPEGVVVMLFYTIGEHFQHAAVHRAKANITALLDVRPKGAMVHRSGKFVSVNPETVEIGEKIKIYVGEKIPLDGILLSEKASLNMTAITGESKPDNISRNQDVFAGSINLDGVIEVQITKEFKDSSIVRILDMVQNANARKSSTELLVRKFARIYTPIVVFLAIGLTFLPYYIVDDYLFREWLYRALIFLVISCPCALVISIPLGYFGGLGAASRNGILFKGASFLDAMTQVNTVVVDKTGTVTKGVFKINAIVVVDNSFTEVEFPELGEVEMMKYLMAMEEQSTHPIAKAILEYKEYGTDYKATNVSEVPGKGLKGTVNGKQVLVGNKALMASNKIEVPLETDKIIESIVMVAIDGKFVGYTTIADELKEDAYQAIEQIRDAGITKVIMLSGDKDSITQKVAKELNIDWAKGGLLPEDKLNEVEELKKRPSTKVAFMGDGINDAPVLAISDIGVAMGGLGSDVAIETADAIIQTDRPGMIARAVRIGRSTKNIVWQNIGLTFAVKIIVLILGAVGLASMWEAVFADVGVALLAIFNAVRLQEMQWPDKVL